MLRHGLLAICAGALAACSAPPAPAPQPRTLAQPAPQPRVKAPRPEPAPERGTAPPKALPLPPESQELAQYYERVQSGLLAQGLLRRDGGGSDTPYNRRILVENFVQIGLFEEYADTGSRLVARATESRLHRFERPVVLDIEFGDSVAPAIRARDTAAIASYAQRLARVTRHPIAMAREDGTAGTDGNFTIFILNEAERRALGPRLQEMVPGISRSALNEVINLPRSSYCLVFALDPSNTGSYTRAVAVIRAEHPDLLRLSCIHEEIAQGLGLANDSPTARPSIFNDDEEFGLLTRHDEQLLRILYDPRMKLGMSTAQARDMAAVIAADFFDENS
ncbi:DUF2927 domain-containing protein [Profundibacterium mesophilum]|uniref:Dihydrolipoamide acetyltransferase n=1 Tax=Profundibacterium mesophilum KAUST100406-0324 TaxID=1037889 RepID=A0A921NTQ8_9RHOB|nr:DUF2927 domain-containing protein [Profundibacterium mesophilum]KAF0675378.1 dihydrolipoamide acetyltransferase [Profundibacterium mesophilum KAUST100406-0324]